MRHATDAKPFRLGTVHAFRPARAARRWLQEERGAAAVEFSIVAPIFIALFFGMTALGSYLRVASDANAAADLIGDLATQQLRVTADELDKFMIAAEAMSTDVAPGKMGIRVDGIRMDPFGVPRIEWTRARNEDILRQSENEEADGASALEKSVYSEGEIVTDLPANLRRPDSFIVRTYITAEWVPVLTAVPTDYVAAGVDENGEATGRNDVTGKAETGAGANFDLLRSRQQKFTRYHAPRLGGDVRCVDC